MCGRYKLVAKIAEGGMGEVLLGIQQTKLGLPRAAVVKRMHEELVDDAEFTRMFLDEARLAALLSHPNIVQTYEVGAHKGRPFMAMEYLEGLNLRVIQRAALQLGKPIPTRLVIEAVMRSLAALSYAHGLKDFSDKPLGLVHRDVSASNIFLSYDGGVRLIDFGVAKAASHVNRTAPGRIKGKFSYMAPEQISASDVDGRADLWSLGVLLWETITGRRLFKGRNDVETLTNIARLDIETTLAESELDPELRHICQRAIRRDPGERFSTAQSMQSALEDFAASMTTTDEPIGWPDYLQDLIGPAMEKHKRTVKTVLAAAAPPKAEDDDDEAPTLLYDPNAPVSLPPRPAVSGERSLNTEPATVTEHTPSARSLLDPEPNTKTPKLEAKRERSKKPKRESQAPRIAMGAALIVFGIAVGWWLAVFLGNP